ncbi:MAG TPA: amidohydrolase family protein [Spirochaetales bacterium]|nr:amidohydrolase family protein [Spirochaetales bacterium]HRY53754.1 amidohydrolase family protein [Spirochaetia bacterium]HRZ63673.1 amidohydrolase family protein [Spirochaetia bacterium]
MMVYEGSIVSCDASRGVYRFLVEDKGRIAFVGNRLPDEYAGAPRTALGARALLPAFADTHIHFMSHALFSAGLDVRAARSVAEAKELVAGHARSEGKVLLGFGTSAHCVRERRLLSRADLDEACPAKPAFVVKYDGHAGVANSALIALLDAKTRALRGFDAESGLMTQEAFFRVTDFVTGKVSLPKTLGDMIRAMDGLAARGVGAVHSVTGVGFPLDLDVTLESLFARGLRDPVQYRVFFQTMEVRKALRRGLPRIGGCFATALDGCFGSADAAMLEPYAPAAALPPGAAKGVLYYPDRVVRAFCVEANRAGLQIELHAIGDAAFEQAVSAIAAALDDFPREDHRHTIIHACLPTARGLESCARLGISIALQTAFLRWEQEPLEYLERIMGERAMRLSPLRAMRDMGIVMSGGSDAPCTVPDPIEGIWAACNHYAPGQSLTIQEAIDLYTRNAAYVGFDEGERGSLEKGKAADMVLLDRDPLGMRPSELRAIKVEGLFLAGEPYRGGQGRAGLLLRGLLDRGRRI